MYSIQSDCRGSDPCILPIWTKALEKLYTTVVLVASTVVPVSISHEILIDIFCKGGTARHKNLNRARAPSQPRPPSQQAQAHPPYQTTTATPTTPLQPHKNKLSSTRSHSPNRTPAAPAPCAVHAHADLRKDPDRQDYHP